MNDCGPSAGNWQAARQTSRAGTALGPPGSFDKQSHNTGLARSRAKSSAQVELPPSLRAASHRGTQDPRNSSATKHLLSDPRIHAPSPDRTAVILTHSTPPNEPPKPAATLPKQYAQYPACFFGTTSGIRKLRFSRGFSRHPQLQLALHQQPPATLQYENLTFSANSTCVIKSTTSS